MRKGRSSGERERVSIAPEEKPLLLSSLTRYRSRLPSTQVASPSKAGPKARASPCASSWSSRLPGRAPIAASGGGGQAPGPSDGAASALMAAAAPLKWRMDRYLKTRRSRAEQASWEAIVCEPREGERAPREERRV